MIDKPASLQTSSFILIAADRPVMNVRLCSCIWSSWGFTQIAKHCKRKLVSRFGERTDQTPYALIALGGPGTEQAKNSFVCSTWTSVLGQLPRHLEPICTFTQGILGDLQGTRQCPGDVFMSLDEKQGLGCT